MLSSSIPIDEYNTYSSPEIIKVKPEEATSVVFGGGGPAVLPVLGGLLLASFPKCKRAAGASMGCLPALSRVMRLTKEQILEEPAKIDTSRFLDKWSAIDSQRRAKKRMPFYKGEVIKDDLLQFLAKFTGRQDPQNITFEDFHKLGYLDFFVVASKQVNGTCVRTVFSRYTTANTPIVEAIRASTAAWPYFPGRKMPHGASQQLFTFYDGAVVKSLVPGDIFDYEVFNDDNASYEQIRDAMRDYENHHDAIQNGIFMRKVDNPRTLIFALKTPIARPYQPLTEDNTLKNVVGLAESFLDALVSHYEDRPQDPQLVRVAFFKRRLKMTDFSRMNDKTKVDSILEGAESFAAYLEIPFDQKMRDELKTIVIKAIDNGKKLQQSPSKWPLSIWQSSIQSQDTTTGQHYETTPAKF